MKQKRIVNFSIFFCLFCANLTAVEERDWVNDWPTSGLPGTEKLPSIDIDEIENYSFSVTYALDGGRFGDQLTNYLKALWISWKYDLPLIFRPFEYSDQLALADFHTAVLNERIIQTFSAKLEYFYYLDLEKTAKVFAYLDKASLHQDGKSPLLWNIGLLTPFIEEHFCEKMDSEEFRELIQQLVKPKNELSLVPLPKDRTTIAIHVRTGEGYDWELNIRNMPTKFPPDTFYVSGLKQAISHYSGKPLYIYIFTDHSEPAIIAEKFLREFNSWGIESDVVFDCRRFGNSHTQNVLEDMFSMAQFDCLIHPDSSLSRLAATLTAPALEIKPSHWGEVRNNQAGNPILDREGHLIVDPLIVERSERGKTIARMHVAPIESSLLFE